MISLTATAAERIRRHLDQRRDAVGLRLGVRRAGCSGYAYTVDYANEIGADDQVSTEHGITVVVSKEHIGLLRGVQVDYARNGLNESFVFANPNAGGSCGCGESFTLRDGETDQI